MSAIYNKSKVTNAWWGINQCNEKVYFSHQPHSFQGFFQTFTDFYISLIIFQTFQGLENFNFKFHDFSRICTNPAYYGLQKLLWGSTDNGYIGDEHSVEPAMPQSLSPRQGNVFVYLCLLCFLQCSDTVAWASWGHLACKKLCQQYPKILSRNRWMKTTQVKWVGFNVPLNTL